MPITDSQETTSSDGLISQLTDRRTYYYPRLSGSTFEATMESIQQQLNEARDERRRSQRSYDYGGYFDYLYSPRRGGRSYTNAFEEYYTTYWNSLTNRRSEKKIERPMTERERYFHCKETKTRWIPKFIINEEE